MNKNTIIGFLLLMALFFGWAYLTKSSKEEQTSPTVTQPATQQRQPSPAADNVQNAPSTQQQNPTKNFGIFSNASEQEEQLYNLENDLFTIAISNKGGIVHHVTLKNYRRYDSVAVTLFDPQTMKFALGFDIKENLRITTENLYYQPVWYDMPENNSTMSLNNADSLRFGMRLYANDTAAVYDTTKYIEYRYTIHKNEYMLGFEILFHNLQNEIVSNNGSINLDWQQDLRSNEKDINNERKATTIYYKINRDEVDYLSDSKESDSKDLPMKLDWISFKSRFFVSTLISQQYPFLDAKVETEVVEYKMKKDKHYLQSMHASISLPWEKQNNDYTIPMNFYFGPNKYHTLKNYDIDMEKLVPLGGWIISWINKGVVWVFDLMSSWHWNYGIIILVLAILIKIILFPIATKSYRSQAVMKVLKPEIEEINKKFPNKEDAMKKQQATMALYKQAGINPLGGCLPMLLQLPILFAMFRFFPSSIELRQEGFLWAKDLSSYDSILDLGFNIPIYGDHVSLFALLMAISTLIYSHISMKNQAGNSQMPGMKFMMYAMPIMFIGIFNSYASALSYYYFLINILTFVQMYIMKFFIDEEKIHQKVKDAKGKPPKKSRWMQRMEDIAKQQQLERRNAQTGSKKKK